MEENKNIIISANSHLDPIIEVGTEIKLSSFYHDIDKYGVEWVELDGWSKRMIEKMCTNGYTPFSLEIRAMAAAIAVVSTNPAIYRNPFTRFLTYRPSLSAKWLTILFEIYINEGEYVWIRTSRMAEVKDLLESQTVRHPLIDYIENRLDATIMSHYVGWDLVTVMIDKFSPIPRAEWHNKKTAETGLVKFSVINS